MGKLRLIIGIVFIAPMFVLLGVIAMIVSGLLWVLKLKNASYAAAHFILGWLVGWIYFFLGVRVKVDGKENSAALNPFYRIHLSDWEKRMLLLKSTAVSAW